MHDQHPPPETAATSRTRTPEQRREAARIRNERREFDQRFDKINFADQVRDMVIAKTPGIVTRLKIGRETISVVAAPLNLAVLREHVSDIAYMRDYFVQAAEVAGDSDGALCIIVATDAEIATAAVSYVVGASATVRRHEKTLASTFDASFVRQQRVLFVSPRPAAIPARGRARAVRRRHTCRSTASRGSTASGPLGRPPRGGLSRPCNPLRRSGGGR